MSGHETSTNSSKRKTAEADDDDTSVTTGTDASNSREATDKADMKKTRLGDPANLTSDQVNNPGSPGSSGDHEDDQGYEDSDEDIMMIGFINNADDDEECGTGTSYDVLSMEQLVQYMEKCINDAKCILELSSTAIRLLLTHFQWDQEKLINEFYEDSEAVLKKVGALKVSQLQGASGSNAKEEECAICIQEKPVIEMMQLNCKHKFCGDCWQEYLSSQIMSEGNAHCIACAHSECSEILEDCSILSIFKDQETKVRFNNLTINGFVQYNRCLRWCPGKGCSNAVRVQSKDFQFQPITCDCGSKFCFECGENWHVPIGCTLLKQWLQKCSDDSETLKWLNVHTKNCPACATPIQKNGGCNHMTCTNPGCRTHFCWICLSNNVGHYACDGYDVGNNQAQEQSKIALQRYTFYHTRYLSHYQSLRLEEQLHAKVEEIIGFLQNYGMSWADCQFLKEAVNVLCQSRETLMYAYAFAYYVERCNQFTLFEDNLSDLHTATEVLSELIEHKLISTSVEMAALKQKTIDQYNYCETRRKVLIDHVREGNDQNWWKYEQL